jgi:hypothetical protein
MTNSIAQTTEYSSVVTNCTNAVRQDINTVNKWQTAGTSVAAFFGTEASLLEVKAQFIADAILPAINKKHADALNVELPRKNSKEYAAWSDKEKTGWELVNQAKKDARATCDTYFARIVKYAFPKDKAESDTTPTSLKTKIQETIADLVKKCQKAEDASFHISSVLEGLEATLKALNSDQALTITVK